MQDHRAGHEYVFDSNKHEIERRRLLALQEVHDPVTQQLLARVGLGAGKACAEIGAGEGSIARFMAASVSPGGKAVAIDINTRFLEEPEPPLEVRRCDITQDALEPAGYDLIHGRFVLLHVKDRPAALANLRQALKPGGVLLLEEPDFRTGLPATEDPELNGKIARVNAAVLSLYSSLGIDAALGAKLPRLLLELGLEEVEVASDLPLAAGGSAIATMMGMSITHLRSRLAATGAASDADIDAYVAATRDAGAWAMYYATISAWGRKRSA
jgi:SAM-dependent methyltransferase